MKKLSTVKVLIVIGLLVTIRLNAKINKEEIDRKVEGLLKQMTLKEKVGQMSQIDINTFIVLQNPHGNFYGPKVEPQRLDKDSLYKYIVEYGISSIFNIGNHGYTFQEWYA